MKLILVFSLYLVGHSFCVKERARVSYIHPNKNSHFNPINQAKRVNMKIFGGGPIKAPELKRVIELVEQSRRGLIKDKNEEIIQMMNAIGANNKKVILEKGEGDWELIWTTEKETLFFISKGLFGAKCLQVSQSIDLKTNQINNLITFDRDRKFSVLGDLSTDKSNTKRINFKFKRADIIIPPIPTLSLPPVGEGWFDNIYCNDMYRLSKDIRGDYLISKRIVDK